MIEKIKLKIIGMHCVSCAMSIDFELEDIRGVSKSCTSYVKQEAIVEYDSRKVSAEKIIQVIVKLGYKAEIVK